MESRYKREGYQPLFCQQHQEIGLKTFNEQGQDALKTKFCVYLNKSTKFAPSKQTRRAPKAQTQKAQTCKRFVKPAEKKPLAKTKAIKKVKVQKKRALPKAQKTKDSVRNDAYTSLLQDPEMIKKFKAFIERETSQSKPAPAQDIEMQDQTFGKPVYKSLNYSSLSATARRFAQPGYFLKA